MKSPYLYTPYNQINCRLALSLQSPTRSVSTHYLRKSLCSVSWASQAQRQPTFNNNSILLYLKALFLGGILFFRGVINPRSIPTVKFNLLASRFFQMILFIRGNAMLATVVVLQLNKYMLTLQ